jgi:hypothetical protein
MYSYSFRYAMVDFDEFLRNFMSHEKLLLAKYNVRSYTNGRRYTECEYCY